MSEKVWTKKIDSIFFLRSNNIESFMQILLYSGLLTEDTAGNKEDPIYRIPNKDVEEYFYIYILSRMIICKYRNRLLLAIN